MKKLVNTKILFLLFTFALGIFQVTARDIYVSPNGSSSGSGLQGSPYSFDYFFTNIINGSPGTDQIINIYFERGGTYSPGNFAFGTTGFASSSWNNKTVTLTEYGSGSSPVIFDGTGKTNLFVHLTNARTSSSQFTLNVKNIIFQNFNETNSNNFILISGAYNKLNLESVTIRGCTNTSGRIFHLNNAYSQLNISGSSIVNNNRGASNLMYIQDGTSNIYNNTFSGNTCNQLFITPASTKFFNNTVYNSGQIVFGGIVNFVNNIVAGSSTYATYNNTASYFNACYRNTQVYLGNLYFNAIGNSDGVAITTAFGQQFDTNLTGTDAGKQVHMLKNITADGHVILNKGGTLTDTGNKLGLSVGTILKYDQLGYQRPEGISLGACDFSSFTVKPSPIISCIYDSEGTPSAPFPVSYNLSQLIEVYPIGLNIDNVSVALQSSGLNNGSVVYSKPNLVFTPNGSNVNDYSEFTVTVSGTDQYGVLQSRTFTVNTLVLDKATYQPTLLTPPPGLTDPLDFPETCFDEMGQVEFDSRRLYKTVSGTNDLLHTFSIPLVGDLDNDGYPEIVALRGGSALTGPMYGVYIINGQTGDIISKMSFQSTTNTAFTFSSTNYHTSPSYMALINSRDTTSNYPGGGKKYAELIVAFSASVTNSSYNQTVVSYDLVKQSNTGTNQYRMVEKWKQKYFTSSDGGTFTKPLPQVLDFDGDGNAEVLVYNKIFDARDGTPRVTFGTLTSNETTCVHSGIDWGTFQGGGVNVADRQQNFSATYDMDFDGKYDYVAGGMVFYDINPSSGAYQTLNVRSTLSIPDGRTGIADINGDGIPDVVVVRRTSTSNSTASAKINIMVWNPGFFVMDTYDSNGKPVLDASGQLQRRTTPNPYLMANVEVRITGGAHGSNSYVYIGDIDGREQVIDGQVNRLPEIAILAGKYTFGSNTLHPNLSGISTIPTSGTGSGDGSLVAFTWDATPGLSTANRLKLSFALDHEDTSANTGFTLFDFDNDGVQEICYRDEKTIRIIKGNVPYIPKGTHSSVVFTQEVTSSTAFEYPVIADVNNDASAEIVTIGGGEGVTYAHSAQVRVFGTNKDKFAPAWPVWNQFMYSPFKIKPDLTVPKPEERITNPLQYKYSRKVKEGGSTKVLYDYQPFNGNIMQAAKFIEIKDASDPRVSYYEPIIFLTEAYVVDNNDPLLTKRPKIVDGSPLGIEITIGNRSTAQTDIATNIPVMVYKGAISKANLVYKQTLDLIPLASGGSITGSIKAGQEVRIKLTGRGNLATTYPGIVDPEGVYWVRLGDNSDLIGSNEVWCFGLNSERDGTPNPELGIGIASRAFRDCSWADQVVRAAKYNAFDDAATVQEYGTVDIDVLLNDILPDTLFNAPSGFSLCASIIKQPLAGYVQCVRTGRNSILRYTHDARVPLTNGVDSLIYQFTFLDPTSVPAHKSKTVTARAYIYVLQSAVNSFASCWNSTHTISLKELPANVQFYWYDENGNSLGNTPSPSRQLGVMLGDSVFQVEPRINYMGVNFPKGMLTVPVVTNPQTGFVTMKWTGSVNTDWNNPANWVQVENDSETPAAFAPLECTNVVISSDAPYYPRLVGPASCNNIDLKDRAMIAGIHHLTYVSAGVELTLRSDERNRFVMWSAPLKSTYTGDYHYKNSANQPQWGDMYMNFFQMANPDYPESVATESLFTASFGNLETSLPLGTPFILKTTNLNENTTLKFPQSATRYTYHNGSATGLLNRTSSDRFITDGVINNVNGNLILPVNGDNAFGMIHVVNPFMAYLNVGDFLTANSAQLERAYKIWDGDINSNFITILTTGSENRYEVIMDKNDMDQLNLNATYIAPLQSFFVMKKNNVPVTSLNMTAAMVTTSVDNSSYILKSKSKDVEEQNILRINATQGTSSNMTVIYNDPEAIPEYDGDEDSRKLFMDGSQVSVYTLALSKEPLAINSNGDYTENIKLGLRLKNAGTVTLEFAGMETFGYNVYLVDHAKGDKIIALNTEPTYTFSVDKVDSNSIIEINDRFSLYFEATITNINDVVDYRNDLIVLTDKGRIYVQSKTGEIQNLQVYTTLGNMIYTSSAPATRYEISVASRQFYLVKAKMGDELKIVKVAVK